MLRGKCAVVTGSTSGIGLAIARGLAARGADLVLNGFGTAGEIEALRRSLAEAHGVRVIHSAADMRSPAEVHGMIDAAIDALGAVDILVNNAGIQHVAPVEEFPDEMWDRILAVNLSAAFHAIQACLPGMRSRGWGRIVNIASVHGLVASPFKAAYVSAKHGLVGLTKTVALETARDGITCNAICPGYVLTPLVDRQVDDQARAHGMPRDEVVERVMLDRQPTRRFVTVEEVAEFCGFLCGDAAASTTGGAHVIDGGWTAL
jgi:3-hydroxybutyrate dehydrogenase